ncbi:MAG TPA: hypothetical protein VKY85_16785 [Candidatus Angelobacter sp.]|nr:hypothetical protein [Candidatus Angelobacter sp.]
MNKKAGFGDLAAVSPTVIANQGVTELEDTTREPEGIVSNTLNIRRSERTFVFKEVAAGYEKYRDLDLF